MKSQLFETIYNGCNSIAENTYLESPLDTELKPPMLMEDIYFECNVKPLFEQVLREMGTFGKTRIASALGNKLQIAREAFDSFAQKLRQENNYTAIHKRNAETDLNEDNHIITAVTETIKIGDTTEQPFRVKDDSGNIIDNSRSNFNNEIENWTSEMTGLLPKSPDQHHCYGFSLTRIKDIFISKYKGILGIK